MKILVNKQQRALNFKIRMASFTPLWAKADGSLKKNNNLGPMQTIEHWLGRNIPVHFKTQKSWHT